jgi:hypothetical protein
MRAALQTAKKQHQSVRAKKKKMDMPIYSHVENILKDYNISAAAYHGGKLNGVDCREFIRLAKSHFFLIFKLSCYLLLILVGAAMI